MSAFIIGENKGEDKKLNLIQNITRIHLGRTIAAIYNKPINETFNTQVKALRTSLLKSNALISNSKTADIDMKEIQSNVHEMSNLALQANQELTEDKKLQLNEGFQVLARKVDVICKYKGMGKSDSKSSCEGMKFHISQAIQVIDEMRNRYLNYEIAAIKLKEAIEKGNYDALKQILDENKFDQIKLASEYKGCFVKAIGKGDAEIIKLFLNYGEKPNQGNLKFAQICSLKTGNTEIITLLEEALNEKEVIGNSNHNIVNHIIEDLTASCEFNSVVKIGISGEIADS